jgi:hypothetical protein
MTTTKCAVSQLQCGDQISLQGHVKTVIAIEGPDRIGTYDIYVQDEHGNKSQEILNGTVTLTR